MVSYIRVLNNDFLVFPKNISYNCMLVADSDVLCVVMYQLCCILIIDEWNVCYTRFTKSIVL